MHLSKEYPPIDGLTDASNPVLSYMLSGIRKVIGSSRQQLIVRFLGESFFLCFIAFVVAIGLVQLLLPLSTDFLRLVVLALLIALPVARLAGNKWLADYPYHVNLSVWLFVGTALLVIGIAVVTVGFQALKAARANPVQSLRAE
jgi:ABC-type antimicrobial peptide transport system permease subunit